MDVEQVLRKKLFLRRGEIRDDLGITDEQMTKLVRGNVLKPVYLCDAARPEKCKGKGKAHAYFVRQQVVQALNGIVEGVEA
jgi:hypothetical protein